MKELPVTENKKMNINTFLIIAGVITLVCVAFAAICLAVSSIKSFDQNTSATAITVMGEGEVTVVPDSATITATIREDSTTVAEAQSKIDLKAKNLTAELEKLGIDKKDIRSLSYSTRPKYEIRTSQCETPPCQSKYELTGYEAIQTVQIKAHKVELAGEIITQLGTLTINEISGPNFAVDDSEKPRAEARLVAIKNSQNKAEAIAKALGVKLGKVVKFEEDNNISKYPIYFAKSISNKSGADAATVPPGEDVIKAKVTVTYSLE
jgi:uncharacterized protein YggE